MFTHRISFFFGKELGSWVSLDISVGVRVQICSHMLLVFSWRDISGLKAFFSQLLLCVCLLSVFSILFNFFLHSRLPFNLLCAKEKLLYRWRQGIFNFFCFGLAAKYSAGECKKSFITKYAHHCCGSQTFLMIFCFSFDYVAKHAICHDSLFSLWNGRNSKCLESF